VLLALFASVAVLFALAGYAAATPREPGDGALPSLPSSPEPTETPPSSSPSSPGPSETPSVACDVATAPPSASPMVAPARLLLAGKKVCVLVRVEVTQANGKSTATVKEIRVSDGGDKPVVNVEIDATKKNYTVEIKYGKVLDSCDKDTRFAFFDNGMPVDFNPVPDLGLSFETWIYSQDNVKRPFKYTKEESFFFSVTCTRP
jgi:hypothetical protein